MARMLRVPRGLPLGPHGFLQAWAGLPVGAELAVSAAWPGVDGLLLALSALARQPLRLAWQRALPGVCGVQAAYLSAPAAAPDEAVALVLTLQLMPPAGWDAQRRGGAQAPGDAAASDAGSDGEGSGGGGGSDAGEPPAAPANGGGGDDVSPAEAARRVVRGMRAAGHVQLRSSCHEVVLAVRDHAAAFVDDLSQATLALGLAPPAVAPSDKPLLHPSAARLAPCFAAAPPAAPLPPQVPAPEMPKLPEFMRKLRDKKDEEDSDAEDEVLPPTEEEQEEQRREMDRHRDACRKVREKHREALAARAAAVLRLSALAEWKRLSGAQ